MPDAAGGKGSRKVNAKNLRGRVRRVPILARRSPLPLMSLKSIVGALGACLLVCSGVATPENSLEAALERYPAADGPYIIVPVNNDAEATLILDTIEKVNELGEAASEPLHMQTYRIDNAVLLIRRLNENMRIYATGADEGLKEDVMVALRKAEGMRGRATVEVEEVRHMKDERELWILKADGPGLAYMIRFMPVAGGGTQMVIHAGARYVRTPAEAKALVDKLR
jgi:hypothetical protein